MPSDSGTRVACSWESHPPSIYLLSTLISTLPRPLFPSGQSGNRCWVLPGYHHPIFPTSIHTDPDGGKAVVLLKSQERHSFPLRMGNVSRWVCREFQGNPLFLSMSLYPFGPLFFLHFHFKPIVPLSLMTQPTSSKRH